MKKFFYWFMFVILYLPFRIIFPVKIIGKKKGKFKGRKIYIANHLHAMDPVMMAFAFGVRVRPLAKKELFKTKIGAAFMNGIGAISVDRASADIKATKQVLTALKKEEAVLIFPEGTRNRFDTQEQLQIKSGTSVFAIKTKTPIVPCFYMSRLKPFRLTKLIVGEPYELGEFYDQKLTPQLLDEAGAVVGSSITQVKEDYKVALEQKKKKKTKVIS